MDKHQPALYFVFAAVRRKGATHGKDPKTVPDGLETIINHFSEYQEKAAVFCHGDRDRALLITEQLDPNLNAVHRDWHQYDVIERVWCRAHNDLAPAEIEEAKRNLSSPSEWARQIREGALKIAISQLPFGPNERRILDALDGVALTKQRLAVEVEIDEGNIARHDGPVDKLKRWGFLINDRSQGGYVRLDAPPPR